MKQTGTALVFCSLVVNTRLTRMVDSYLSQSKVDFVRCVPAVQVIEHGIQLLEEMIIRFCSITADKDVVISKEIILYRTHSSNKGLWNCRK